MLSLLCFQVPAQTLTGLYENQVIKKYRAYSPPALKAAEQQSCNTLPFFEDFSSGGIYPDPSRWSDRDVFINNSFAVNPVSVGVATFDAIDEFGNVTVTNDFPAVSDRLTSLPFNLQPYSASGETVRLSFFYQCGGKGELPEMEDSLKLEFYSPAEDRWSLAWYAVNDTLTGFEQVILAIPVSFYSDGFRFRFSNYVSLSASGTKNGKGALSNVDCWNIDYIMMNTSPVSQHQSISDITILEPPGQLLDFYETIPWSHLNAAQSITRNMIRYAIRNLEKNADSVNVGRSYYMHNLNTGYIEFGEQYYGKFGPNSLAFRSDPFFAPFTNSGKDREGTIEVGAFLITPAGQNKENDTSKTVIRFRDTYAYDDGIPEYGFGIPGESAYGASLACRFRLFRADTLRAVDIFFNKTRENFNATLPFRLCVWADDNGKPGELLYTSDDNLYPGVPDGFLEFSRYPIEAGREPVISDSVVYVGLMQLTEEFLNVGFDVNRNNLANLFVNISGGWFNPGQSFLPGSLMIRPVLGSLSLPTGMHETMGSDLNPLFYPNPVSDRLFIGGRTGNGSYVEIFDVTGRQVVVDNVPADGVEMSWLPSGIYLVRLNDSSGMTSVGKVIVSH